MELTKIDKIMELLPGLDCGACGYRSCEDFAPVVMENKEELKKGIHIANKVESKENHGNCLACAHEGMGLKMGWKDNLQRDFDFIMDCFENEPGPRETILPYNPALVKELGVK